MESLIPSFVSALGALHLDLDPLRQKLRKPLRPLWITPSSVLPTDTPRFGDFHPVVCCTASRRVEGGESSEGGYIQGAADDSEAWAHGLTASVFWEHRDELLAAGEAELPGLIAGFVQQEAKGTERRCQVVRPTGRVFLGTLEGLEAMVRTEKDVVVSVGVSACASLEVKGCLHLKCAAGKVGSRQLRHDLPKVLHFVRERLQELGEGEGRILVVCATGKDHSVGVVLAILCLFVNDDGSLRPKSEVGDIPTGLNKQTIKQRLSWISVSQPDANPSRATLQSVNAFLLG